jgi:hypothetical protein
LRNFKLAPGRELRDREQLVRALRLASVQRGFRGSQRSSAAALDILAKHHGPLEKRSGGTEPSTSCCSSGRLLQLDRDLILRALSRERAMPSPPIGIERRVNRFGERVVGTTPSLRLSVPVYRRPNQGMPKHDPHAHTEQAGALQLTGAAAWNAQKVRSAPHEDRITGGFGRSDQLQRPRRGA